MRQVFVIIFSDFFSCRFYYFLFLFLSPLPWILRKFEDIDKEFRSARPKVSTALLYRVFHLACMYDINKIKISLMTNSPPSGKM